MLQLTNVFLNVSTHHCQRLLMLQTKFRVKFVKVSSLQCGFQFVLLCSFLRQFCYLASVERIKYFIKELSVFRIVAFFLISFIVVLPITLNCVTRYVNSVTKIVCYRMLWFSVCRTCFVFEGSSTMRSSVLFLTVPRKVIAQWLR